MILYLTQESRDSVVIFFCLLVSRQSRKLRVLWITQNLVILRCFGEDGKEMYQEL